VLAMLRLFPRRRDKLRLLGVWLALEGKHWLGWFARRSFGLRWRGPTGSVAARFADVSELWAVWETFVNEEYASVLELEPRVILDLGANVGNSALYFAAVRPGARIIAVEGAPHTYELLRENTAHLRTVTCVHAAVTDRVGTATIFSGRRSLASSLTAAPGAQHRAQGPRSHGGARRGGPRDRGGGLREDGCRGCGDPDRARLGTVARPRRADGVRVPSARFDHPLGGARAASTVPGRSDPR
jgi:hypothetical protein